MVNNRGQDIYKYKEDIIFIPHPNHDTKVAQYIDRVQRKLEIENETEYFVYSFRCDVDLTDLNPAE